MFLTFLVSDCVLLKCKFSKNVLFYSLKDVTINWNKHVKVWVEA